jgi:ABC-type antimicrobial peptide transport system permease subunit
MGGVGVLGLLLAAIGLYGVLAYTVAGRTREIGVRIAVGAGAGQISRMILLDAGRMLAAGSLIGLGVAFLVTAPLAMFLVPGLSPSDPVSYASVILVLAFSGTLAALGPVRRAVGIDPVRALRHD